MGDKGRGKRAALVSETPAAANAPLALSTRKRKRYFVNDRALGSFFLFYSFCFFV